MQNQPTRKKERARVIKRQFVATRGRLLRKRDLSAHEVRVLGITACDDLLGERFWVGMQVRLRHEYQWTISEERRKHWTDQLNGADVHRQNYAMMYGVDPLTVTKPQRDSIKVPMFSATYGKSMPTLGEELKTEVIFKLEDREHLARNGSADGKTPPLTGEALRTELARIAEERRAVDERDWTAYAQGLYREIFEKKFTVSGRWLTETMASAARTLHAPNIMGGVRHLFGYLHPSRSIQRACDRRGPNSVIQGPASNLGLLGSWFLREMVWKWFVRHGVPIDLVQCNSVHDSSESEASIVQIPLLCYLEHHAFTTRVHRFMRAHGHPFGVGLESDVEIGPALSEMREAVRWDAQVEAIRAGIRWGNDHQDWRLPEERLMRAVEHNARIIHELRREEIARQLRDGERTNLHMAMSERNARRLGLVHEVPGCVPVPLRRVRDEARRRETTRAARAPRSLMVYWRDELEEAS